MNEKIKAYCPYCGIELDVIDTKENKKTMPFLYNAKGSCCNCNSTFHWISCKHENGVVKRTGFSQIFDSVTR